MNWTRKTKYCSESDHGYLVSALKGPRGEGWIFMAWGPQRPEWKLINKYLRSTNSDIDPGSVGLKERYQIGDQVPEPREWLGRHERSEQARQACKDHWEKNNERTNAA